MKLTFISFLVWTQTVHSTYRMTQHLVTNTTGHHHNKISTYNSETQRRPKALSTLYSIRYQQVENTYKGVCSRSACSSSSLPVEEHDSQLRMFEKVRRNQELEVSITSSLAYLKQEKWKMCRLLTNETRGAYPSLAVWKSKIQNSLNSKNEDGHGRRGRSINERREQGSLLRQRFFLFLFLAAYPVLGVK